jgi:hypothetical protein
VIHQPAFLIQVGSFGVEFSRDVKACDAWHSYSLSLDSSSCIDKILSLPSLDDFAEGSRLTIAGRPIVIANLIPMIEVAERLEVTVRLTGFWSWSLVSWVTIGKWIRWQSSFFSSEVHRDMFYGTGLVKTYGGTKEFLHLHLRKLGWSWAFCWQLESRRQQYRVIPHILATISLYEIGDDLK